MAITHLSLVNQKLAHAKALLSLLLVNKDPNNRLQQTALTDGCALQISLAYHFYLRELAENHGVKNPGAIQDIHQLNNILSAIDKTSSEVAELTELEAVPHSWVRHLMDYVNGLYQSPTIPKAPKAFAPDNLIQAVEITETFLSAKVLGAHDLSNILENFHQLILRQRETSAEY